MRKFRKAYILMPQWGKFYKEAVCNGSSIFSFHKDSSIRVSTINNTLEEYHAKLEGQHLVFDSKAHYTWFVLRWS